MDGQKVTQLGVIFFQSLTLRWFLSAGRTQQMELGGKGEAESRGGLCYHATTCLSTLIK